MKPAMKILAQAPAMGESTSFYDLALALLCWTVRRPLQRQYAR